MPVTLDKLETQIVFSAKGHYKEKDGLEKLYREHYKFDSDSPTSLHIMLFPLFFKIWRVRGSHEDQLSSFLFFSLPTQTWKVGGKNFGMFPDPAKCSFNEWEIIGAQILAILSYIRLTEIKYLELAEVKDPILSLKPESREFLAEK